MLAVELDNSVIFIFGRTETNRVFDDKRSLIRMEGNSCVLLPTCRLSLLDVEH